MPRDPATHVGITLRIGKVDIPTCDPDSSAPSGLSGLTVTWGRDGRLDKPAATTCSFELVDSDGGTSFHDVVRFNSEVRVSAPGPSYGSVAVFLGTVTDLEVTRDDAGDTLVKVTAIDYTARMSAISMGDQPWPQQSSQARWQAINAAIPPGVEVGIPNTVPNVTMAPMDVDNQSIAQVVEDFAWGLGRIPWPITTYASGSLSILAAGYKFTDGGLPTSATQDTRATRREPTYGLTAISRTVCIDACDVDLDGTEFSANPDDVRQPIRVTYGGSGTEGTYNIDNVGAVVDQSRRFDVISGVAAGSSPQVVAGQWLRQMADWDDYFDAPWRVGALRLDPDSVTGIDNFDQAMEYLLDYSRRIDRPVLLQQLPTWTPWRDAADHTHEPNVVGRLQGGTYTFTDGRWVLDIIVVVDRPLATALAPAPGLVVRPGDSVPYDHNTGTVAFVPQPATAWQPGQVAYFTDGAYGWDGTTWVSGGVQPITVRPGATVAVPHDDPRVRPQPTTAWATDDYATFSDGRYHWDGSAWQVYRLPGTVWPYATVTFPHTQPDVTPDPTGHWWVPGSGSSVWAPAWFSDGAWSWQRTYWGRAYVTEPGNTLLGSTYVVGALILPAVTPWPTDPWADGDYAIIGTSATDWNTYRWDGGAWALTPVPRVVVTPGSTVDVPHDDLLVEPDPTTEWADDDYATFSDGTFRWDGGAWVAYAAPMEPWPGATLPLAHDDPLVILPGVPAARWPWDGEVNSTVAGFSDGAYAWRESSTHPQGYWVQLSSFTATASLKYAWLPLPHDHAAINPPRTDATTVVLFSDGPYEASGGAYVPTDRAGYDGATVPYAHTDARVVAIPGVPWPTNETDSRGHPLPYVTFTDGRYRWDGAAWVPYAPPVTDTTWAGAPEGVAWNDVPAGTSWTEWTGDI